MLNHVTMMGRLCADPDLRYTNAQKPVTTFRIAVERDYDKEKKSDFFGCSAWNQTAEFVKKYFAKGSMAVVTGHLQIREWTDRNGNKRNESEIIVEHIYFGERADSRAKETFTEAADSGELPF